MGSAARERGDTARLLSRIGITTNSPEATPATTCRPSPIPKNPEPVEPEVEESVQITGHVEVKGGETVVGGGQSKRPLQRIVVDNFLISETEVTNGAYVEFVSETNYREPEHWKDGKYLAGTESYPVVNVSACRRVCVL